ncbi:lpg1716 family Dot/Icm T4SS effector [Legionella pneumophila serogroup 1]|uniref:lpg1716 family Dot/Icm T4SS effector n=1 Tax=Legionella pneumophila TaxID=446 RepID=UPI00058CD885|nr:lpg1716 family Dot/Icm T4SS effector [Legionella pneumophila]HAT8850731.1 lpg1716 family Dot/Icm T4SS effector [Legionella pneumophila subsp. pneumophila]MCO1453181.1 lpg1716 family Dot/Icm T4SS effector [Legionella pneumophila]MCZ4687585.1 lpg1716 family Dot/Icm T4SS effector [Legionella pneumophila]MCZ4721793.1 lpg1716 family Dot/Icm T4SS effector [Legionella pneumophila]MCZ4728009.1 lpg1716 family Dot/Icm T4SS effector [Legionella pneumophila]
MRGHMIFLSIPKGMEFKQITEKDNTNDYFVDPNGKLPRINIQALVKDALQYNKGRKKEISLPDFTIYRHKPPYRDELFLQYNPNHNGKYFTKESVNLVNGKEFIKYKTPATSYGTFWFQKVQLSESRMDEVLAQRSEQRENRRHTGDSPNPT